MIKDSQDFSNKLPPLIEKMIDFEETLFELASICAENGIQDEKRSEKIASYTASVLMGNLPPEEFQEVLEKELFMDRKTSTKITQEIGRLIFLPIKSGLEKIYSQKNIIQQKPEKEDISSVEKETLQKPDDYREPIK